MNQGSKDPDMLVAQAIAERFESEGLLGAQKKEVLVAKIAKGNMDLSDWMLLAEHLDEQKE